MFQGCRVFIKYPKTNSKLLYESKSDIFALSDKNLTKGIWGMFEYAIDILEFVKHVFTSEGAAEQQ